MKRTKMVKALLTRPGDFGHDPGFVLPADTASYDKLVEQVADECAVEITSSYTRGQLCMNVVSEKREDYVLARAALKSIGITRPSK